MEQAILSSLTKKGNKTKPTNIKIPKDVEEQSPSDWFLPSSASEETSMEHKLLNCTLSESEIANCLVSLQENEEKVESEELKTCTTLLSDLGLKAQSKESSGKEKSQWTEQSLATKFYLYCLILRLPITKQFMTSELVAKNVDMGQILETLYVLLLLKMDEEQTQAKYSKFFVIPHDNLLTWSEAIMDACLLKTILGQQNDHEQILTKIRQTLDVLSEQQDLMMQGQAILHNACLNEGITF